MNAFLITLRETLQFSAVLFLLAGVYREHVKTIALSAAVAVSAGWIITAMNFPVTGALEQSFSTLMFGSFLIILILSFIATKHAVFPAAATILAILFPSAQLASVILGESLLKGGNIYIFSAAGAVPALALLTIAYKKSRLDLQKYFNNRTTMVFLASFCFMTGGSNEFSDASIIVFLQKGSYAILISMFSAFKDTVFSQGGTMPAMVINAVITFLSSERFAMAITAVILFVPPVYVFVTLLLQPEPSTEKVEIKAEKRKILAIHTDELIRKGTPILLALLINIVLLHAANLAMTPSHDPEPAPLVIEGDTVRIPVKSALDDLSDGKLRKYSIRLDGSTYRFIVMKRPDGTIITALDACEICPPWGYLQRGKHLICKYCGTPIPVDSLGITGGCNPIPVESTVKKGTVQIKTSDISATYKKWIDKK